MSFICVTDQQFKNIVSMFGIQITDYNLHLAVALFLL